MMLDSCFPGLPGFVFFFIASKSFQILTGHIIKSEVKAICTQPHRSFVSGLRLLLHVSCSDGGLRWASDESSLLTQPSLRPCAHPASTCLPCPDLSFCVGAGGQQCWHRGDDQGTSGLGIGTQCACLCGGHQD